jgi:hypothetical protein
MVAVPHLFGANLGRGALRFTSACRHVEAPIKPGQVPGRSFMAGIAVIVIFVVVIAIFNRVEFGRFD